MSASDTKEGLQRCHADVLVLRVTLKGYNYKKQHTKIYPTLAKPSYIRFAGQGCAIFESKSLEIDTRSDGAVTEMERVDMS